MSNRSLSRPRRALFVALAAIVPLLGLELSARLLIALSPAFAALASYSHDAHLRDPELRWRGNPAFPDHDEAGWRNAGRPARATVVAIGDSQTWGEETSRDAAWPQQAEAASGIPFYNASLGGYGPVQYGRLVEEALTLAPETIVVAFYEGNDFYDAYRDVYLAAYGREWLDPDKAASLAALETREALHGDWWQTRRARRTPVQTLARRWTRDLAGDIRLYGLLRGLLAHLAGPPAPRPSAVRDDFPSYLERIAESEPGLYVPFEAGARSTIFTPRGRLQPMQLADPRVRESLRLVFAIIDDMQRRSRGRSQLAFLLIPTKELVYADLVRDGGLQLHASYHALISAETDLRRQLMAHLDARGIPWTDSLPELRASLAAGQSPYLMDWNGHPNAAGNAAIARAALALAQPR